MIELSDQHRDFQEAIRSFARREVMPDALSRDENAEDPAGILKGLAELGATGITVPAAYGGLGLDPTTLILTIEELGYADASVGSALGGHYLAMEGFLLVGGDAVKAKYLPGLASGELRAAFALTEPDAGSDIASMRSNAVRDCRGWRLNGTKIFISSARESDVMLVFAKTDGHAGFRGISAFAVPSHSDGIEFSAPLAKLGCRGEHAYEVSLRDVLVPADALLGEENAGGRLAMQVVNSSRIDVAALANGVARRALDLALGYSSARVQFGRSIRDFQAIQLSLGQMDVLVETARLATYEAARAKEAGKDIRRASAIAKYVASENCFTVVDKAMQIHGGYGYMKEAEIERLYRDCRLFRIYEGTSDIQLLTLAKLLPADPLR
jgi:alkylation response protein AidB-like acyl-CoA dehydrogenase